MLLCLMKVVLQVQVDGMVQSISTHSVKALKILVRQLKYMLIKVKGATHATQYVYDTDNRDCFYWL